MDKTSKAAPASRSDRLTIQRPAPKQDMPQDAKCVFKGVIFDVYQWEQELFDGTKATFEKLKRADTAVVIPVTAEGKIILLEEQQPGRSPILACPGGRIDPGEDPVAAARRELREETGHDSDDIVLWNAVQPASKLDWAIYTFIARNCYPAGEQSMDPGENIKLMLVSFGEFVDRVTTDDSFPETKIAIDLLRAKLDPEKMSGFKDMCGLSPDRS